MSVLFAAWFVSCGRKTDQDNIETTVGTTEFYGITAPEPDTLPYEPVADTVTPEFDPSRVTPKLQADWGSGPYKEGYDIGYDDGQVDGEHNESHGYSYDDSSRYRGKNARLYRKGYEEGYDDGYNDGLVDFEESGEDEDIDWYY